MADDSLRFIKNLTWDETFSVWRDGEAHLSRWIEHYQEKGFDSWDAWRAHTLKDLPCAGLVWNLHEIMEPEKAVQDFLGGPFRPWIKKYYGDAAQVSFHDLVMHDDLRESRLVQGVLRNFPKETTLIGLATPSGIVILEGMHRCCGLAVAAREGRRVSGRVFISLANYDGPLPLLGSEGSPT